MGVQSNGDASLFRRPVQCTFITIRVKYLPPQASVCRHGKGRREGRVEIVHLVKQFKRVFKAFPGGRVRGDQTTRVEAPGIQAIGRPSFCPAAFHLIDLGRDRRHDRVGNLLLYLENIGKIRVETLGPQMATHLGVDQLAGDPDPITTPAHVAFHYVANT